MIPCPTPRLLAHLALRHRAIQDLGVFPELFQHASPAWAGRSEVLPGSPVHASGRVRVLEVTDRLASVIEAVEGGQTPPEPARPAH